jgi:hypothetical protein
MAWSVVRSAEDVANTCRHIIGNDAMFIYKTVLIHKLVVVSS